MYPTPPITPRPPAFVTAAARSGPALTFIPARITLREGRQRRREGERGSVRVSDAEELSGGGAEEGLHGGLGVLVVVAKLGRTRSLRNSTQNKSPGYVETGRRGSRERAGVRGGRSAVELEERRKRQGITFRREKKRGSELVVVVDRDHAISRSERASEFPSSVRRPARTSRSLRCYR